MSKILVSGGAGYIGSNTAYLLRQRGFDVVILDDLSRGHQHNLNGFPFHQVTLADTKGVAHVLASERCDAVVHFAAYIAVGESTADPELYFQNNLAGTVSLFSAMAQTGVKQIVFSSTAAVYGMPVSTPILETAPYAPISPYGESKVMVEKILNWLDQLRGVRSVILRYFNACGADPDFPVGEEHDPETHLIPLVLRAIVTGEPIAVFGNDYDTPDGTCIRDYIHVSDLAEAHVLALHHLMQGGASEAFNVGTGTGHSVLEVIRAAEKVTGRQVPYRIGPRRAGDSPELVADSTKLRSAFGWRPRYPDLEEMVRTAWQFEQKRLSRENS